jgi:hypothetical protein
MYTYTKWQAIYCTSHMQACCEAFEVLTWRPQPRSVALGSTASSPGPGAPHGWPWEAYGGVLTYDDLTPNIGLWWYELSIFLMSPQQQWALGVN